MPLFRIWLLRGFAGSGKDTVAAILRSCLDHAEQSSFASAVKDEVAAMYEFDRAYLDTQEGKARIVRMADGTFCTVRDLIIEHGQSEKKRHDDLAVWARRVKPSEMTREWILSDWRFPEEFQCLQERFPDTQICTIHIYRNSIVPLTDATEHQLDTFKTDYQIDNSSSITELEQKIREILTYANNP